MTESEEDDQFLEEASSVEEEIHHTVPQALFNPTLGAAANGVFLDVMEAQAEENRRAEIENRPARIAKREERYPGYVPSEVTSLYDDVSFGVHYEDGEKVNAPQGGNVTPVAGQMAAAQKALSKGVHGVAERSRGRSGPSASPGGSGAQKPAQGPSQSSGGKSEHS